MKFILIYLTLLSFNFKANAWIKIEKKDGGLLGYKLVSYSESGPNQLLACSDPGRQKCKFPALARIEDGEIIDESIIDAIDVEVTAKVKGIAVKGEYISELGYFVKYFYDIESNSLAYEIYTIKEATSNGFI